MAAVAAVKQSIAAVSVKHEMVLAAVLKVLEVCERPLFDAVTEGSESIEVSSVVL